MMEKKVNFVLEERLQGYVAPQIEVLEVIVEHGFAASSSSGGEFEDGGEL